MIKFWDIKFIEGDKVNSHLYKVHKSGFLIEKIDRYYELKFFRRFITCCAFICTNFKLDKFIF